MAISRRRAAVIGGVGLLGLMVIGAVRGGAEHDRVMAASKEAMRPFEIAERMNPEVKGWRYTSEKDEMRGLTTKVAKLQADDYNTYMTPTLTVWRREGGGKGVQLDGPSVVNGVSPSCDYRSSVVTVKIDDGPVRQMHCVMGMSVGIDSSLLKMLKGSKRLMLETDSNVGKQQYTFSTAGLTL